MLDQLSPFSPFIQFGFFHGMASPIFKVVFLLSVNGNSLTDLPRKCLNPWGGSTTRRIDHHRILMFSKSSPILSGLLCSIFWYWLHLTMRKAILPFGKACVCREEGGKQFQGILSSHLVFNFSPFLFSHPRRLQLSFLGLQFWLYQADCLTL